MARARWKPAAETDFSDFRGMRHWFEGQARGAAVTMVVRSALRVLPLAIDAGGAGPSAARVLLPALRALAIAWAAAEYRALAERLRPYATVALNAIPIAISGAVNAAAVNTTALNAVDAATAAAAAAIYAAHAAAAAAAAADTDTAAAYAAAGANAANAANANAAIADTSRRLPAHRDRIAIAAAAIFAAATQTDATAIERGKSSSEVVGMPLWIDVGVRPETIAVAWTQLQINLLAAGDDWDVWVRWYQDRLDGGPSLGEEFDLAVATLPSELWAQGPAAVNGRIKELIAEHTPAEPIPTQGAGPHFALSPDLKIALAPPGEIDASGNNLARIGNLLPVVRQAAGDLAGYLNPNTQPEIGRIVGDYRAAIAGEAQAIAWGTVFGLGVRLDNAAAAARRDIADRLRDPLEDAPQEALDSLLALHGPLMLATAEGRELSDNADGFRQTREQQAELRRHAQTVAANLANSPDIIEAPAARLGEEAAAAIGEGPHPERGTIFGLATLKHAATIFIPAATLATLVPVGIAAAGLAGGIVGGGIAWAGYESLKKSNRFETATKALGPVWDQLLTSGEAQALRTLVRLAPFRSFVAQNEEPLRRIAENTTQLRWTLRYIDFILRTNGPRND